MDSEAQRASLLTPASWASFFEAKRELWFLQDPTFELEAQHVRNLAGDRGGKLLIQQAFGHLPSKCHRELSYAVVATHLR